MPYHLFYSIYTPFTFHPSRPPTISDLLGIEEIACSEEQLIPEVFYFEYGVVVIWGMKENEEKDLLGELVSFEEEKLGKILVNFIIILILNKIINF